MDREEFTFLFVQQIKGVLATAIRHYGLPMEERHHALFKKDDLTLHEVAEVMFETEMQVGITMGPATSSGE